MTARSLSSQKLSRSTKQDPSRTKGLRSKYERKLVRLMRDYKKGALQALQNARALEVRKPPVSPVNLGIISDLLDSLGLDLKQTARPAVEEQVDAATRAGTRFAGQQIKAIGLVTAFGPDDAVVDRAVLQALEARNLAALKGITDECSKQIMRELSDGVSKGEGIPKLAKRIAGRCDNIGIARARTLARTETLHAFNESAKQRYQQHGIKRVEWLTAIDDRTCPDCLALNGKQFDAGSAPPCPLHPNCRCTLLPVIPEAT